MLGHDSPTEVDVLHALADSRAPVGARLAAHGLTEQRITDWRRVQSPAPLDPVLKAEVSPWGPGFEQLLSGALLPGPVLNLDVARSRVVVAVLRSDSVEVGELLAAFGVDRQLLASDLLHVDPGSAPFPRRYPGMTIAWRLERLVLIPHTVEDGRHRELPSRAHVTMADISDDELNFRIAEAFDRYGEAHDEGAEPYWRELGYKTSEGFLRRARVVLATRCDFSVEFRPTAHVGRVRFDIIGDASIRAPLDDHVAIARAARYAEHISKG